jgi:RHS repeat-associated protein
VRILRGALAGSLALLVATTGCGSTSIANQTSGLTAASQTYFHRTYAAGPELTTDVAGALQEDRRTEPYGAAIDALAGGAVQAVDYRQNPINALNKFTDPDTAWSDHGARWLTPDTAQWNMPDPPTLAPDARFMADPWSLHPYQYVGHNPVAFWDPDGRQDAVVTQAAPLVPPVLASIGALATDAAVVLVDALPVVGPLIMGSAYVLTHGGGMPEDDPAWHAFPDLQKRALAKVAAQIQKEQAAILSKSNVPDAADSFDATVDTLTGDIEAKATRREDPPEADRSNHTLLYRGVPYSRTSPAYSNALTGLVMPIQMSDRDDDIARTTRALTLWTENVAYAVSDAESRGSGGIVISAWVPNDQILSSPVEDYVYVNASSVQGIQLYLP